MIEEIFFTLTEYKRNYERILNEFVNAYEDNDEDEFISLQTELYQKCLETAKIERGFAGDTIGWFPKSLLNGNGVIWKVDEKIRDKNGDIDRTVAQNLSVSFGKILKYLKGEAVKPKTDFSATKAMLYHYVLQEAKLEPPFPDGGKEKALENLSKRYGFSKDNLKKKYNSILRSGGKRGYKQGDAVAVLEFITTNNPSAMPTFKNITEHVLI